jgi:hypothetical protein
LRADKTAIIHAASKAEHPFNRRRWRSDDTASSAEGAAPILEAA